MRGPPHTGAGSALRALGRRSRAELREWSGQNARHLKRLDGTCAAVLTYHRVLPRSAAEAASVEPGMYVTPQTFARHLDWLCESYRILPLNEIVDRLTQGKTLPTGAVAITFDDGWRDNHEYAFAQLAARSLPATAFIVTQRVGSDGAFWPDEVCRRMAQLSIQEGRMIAEKLGAGTVGDPTQVLLAHFKSLPEHQRSRLHDEFVSRTPPPPVSTRELLNWNEIENAAADGIDFESHGATHAILDRIDPEIAQRELGSSLSTLRERGLARHGFIAYPSGGYSEQVAQLAEEVGYTAAFTTEPALITASCPPMARPRLALHDDISGSRSEFRHLVPGDAPGAPRS